MRLPLHRSYALYDGAHLEHDAGREHSAGLGGGGGDEQRRASAGVCWIGVQAIVVEAAEGVTRLWQPLWQHACPQPKECSPDALHRPPHRLDGRETALLLCMSEVGWVPVWEGAVSLRAFFPAAVVKQAGAPLVASQKIGRRAGCVGCGDACMYCPGMIGIKLLHERAMLSSQT